MFLLPTYPSRVNSKAKVNAENDEMSRPMSLDCHEEASSGWMMIDSEVLRIYVSMHVLAVRNHRYQK